MKNQARENKCYMVNESYRSWYFEVWAREWAYEEEEKESSTLGAATINKKRVGLWEGSGKE